MTDENKFFRYIWRFNALALACVAIAAAGAILYNAINPWRPAVPEPAGNFAPIPRKAEDRFTYRLQSHGENRLIGREELIALDRWKGAPETYGLKHMEMSYSASFTSTRSVNLLAIDKGTADSHWVFRGYDRAIIGSDPVYAMVPPVYVTVPVPANLIQPQSTAVALVMTVVDLDTNKDGELSEKDRQSLYVYRPGEAEAARLLTADLIVSSQQSRNDRYIVIYENGSSAVAATYSVPDFKLIAQKQLPKVPQ